MVLKEEEYKTSEETRIVKTIEEKEQEDLDFGKRHQNATYKMLKYNPIDPLNDLYRKAIERLDLEEVEGKLQWWAAFIYVKFFARLLWNFKAEYPLGNMFPEYGPGILVGNHESHLDPFFYGAACHRRIRYMSKLDNFKTPIVRTLFTNLGAFKLDRENPEPAWEMAKEIIRGGEWVGIFPEGTRSREETGWEVGEFKTGAVRLAIEMKVPIVPMAVIGSRNALPKGKLVMKPTQVKVRVGDPIYYDQYNINKISYDEIRRLTAELRQIIIDLRDYVIVDPRKQEKQEELSIGSPEDAQKQKESFSLKSYLKDVGKGALQLIDDIWYSLLKSLEVFGVRDQFQNTVQNFSGWLVCNWSNLMMPYKVIDYEKYIPDKGAAVVCTNHNSEWDVLILAASLIYHRKRVLYQMAKQSLFKPPLVNAWIRNHHAFPLKRGQHDVDSYNYAKNVLDKGELVCVYPEGTTNPGGGDLLEGHTGAMRLAIEKQVPILLIGITGTEETYPKHAKMLNFYRGQIMKAGPAFMEHKKYWGKPMPDYDELKRLTANMMAQIKDLLLYDSPDA
ncbi:MAG: lysophospholipid acyltransferase family protein [Candidatus Hermodarchaeota archaeon]